MGAALLVIASLVVCVLQNALNSHASCVLQPNRGSKAKSREQKLAHKDTRVKNPLERPQRPAPAKPGAAGGEAQRLPLVGAAARRGAQVDGGPRGRRQNAEPKTEERQQRDGPGQAQ